MINKKEVLIDTGFLEKLSCNGKNLEVFKKVLTDLEYKPVVHPYIAANELDMYTYFDNLVTEGFIRIANYNEFLYDDEDRTIYQSFFIDIHNMLREYLKAAGFTDRAKCIYISQSINEPGRCSHDINGFFYEDASCFDRGC